MDVTLCNPTNETIEPYFGGKVLVFKPGAKKRVDGPVGSHIMNNFEMRGMVSLDYGDETATSPHDKKLTVEEYKLAKGKRLNKEFKTKQVSNYNQQNEKRKQESMSFLDPTPMVKGYAEEMGLELISPYTVRDNAQAKINEMKDENQQLRDDNRKLQDNMMTLMGKVDQLIAGKDVTKEDVVADLAEKTDQEQIAETLKKKFMKLGKDNFKGFCKNNLPEIKAWPEEVKTLVREKRANMGLPELVI